MKGRIIGALWIIAALSLTYFTFDGQYFSLLMCVCLFFALCEEVAGAVEPWRPKGADSLRNMPDIEASILAIAMLVVFSMNRYELLLVILVCCLSDVGAFAIGMLIGKHKVKALKGVSPNKSWEGYIAGAIFPVLAIWIGPLFGISIGTEAIAYIACGGVLAEVGDLLGSATKRRLCMKDSNEAVMSYRFFRIVEYPVAGHGGYLDRLDSWSLGFVGYAIIRYLVSLF